MKNKYIEIEYSPPGVHSGTGAVERAIKTLKNLIIAILEAEIGFTKSISQALRINRFTIHTGIKVSSLHKHHGKKPRTELADIVKDFRNFFSD